MDESAVEVSVVLPCLNEERTLGSCIRMAQQVMRGAGLSGEVVVADNGSSDRSREIALAERAVLVPVSAKGYGNALYHGFKRARGKYLVFLDADMSYDFTHIPLFVEKLKAGADLVMGSRFRGRIATRAMPLLHRYLGTPVLTTLANIFFGAHISDINCGMRAVRKESFERLGLRAGGMEFASELLIKSVLLKMKVEEIPTNLYPDRRARPPHLRSWRDGWRHLRFMLLFCPTWLFEVPGLAMTAGGLLLILAVIMSVSPLIGILTSLLALAATVLGVQVIFLGIAAHRISSLKRWYAIDEAARKLLARFSLEKGLAGGGILAACGALILIFAAAHIWSFMRVPHAAGVIDLLATRLALLGTVFLVGGIQTVFFSFFLSLFEIETVEA